MGKRFGCVAILSKKRSGVWCGASVENTYIRSSVNQSSHEEAIRIQCICIFISISIFDLKIL